MQTPETLKFVLLGDKGIGKRTILSTGFDKPERLSPLYLPIEFVEINVRGRTKNWNAICYDSLVSSSSVQKNEATIVEGYTARAVSGADAILFCYAGNDAASLRNLNRWYKDVAVHLSPNTLIYLVETKTDLPNKINENDEKDFTSHIKFQNHFKINGQKRDLVLNIFASITEKVEGIRSLNLSQRLDKTSTYYKSPEKKATNGPIQDVRYSDKKEKIVLMEGSYVKKLSVVESKRTASDSQRLQQKHLGDDDLKGENF